MQLRHDIDGWLVVTNAADTYAVVLATAPDYQVSEADGFVVMIVSTDGDIQRSAEHETLQAALRDYITLLDRITD